jgi:hypothetical protein
MQDFLGYHSEWNLGSPGGWDYQRMAQELGRLAWQKIIEKTGIKINLDFNSPILNPVPAFAQLLLGAHKERWGKRNPFIALVAEEETLEKVGENIRFVEYLNSLEGVHAALTAPHKLETKNGEVLFEGRQVTLVFLDFNNNVLSGLKKKYNLDGLLAAIKKRLVVNPRGMEPLGAKGIFEAVTDRFRGAVTDTTFRRTPWTRRFYPRSTTGPDGNKIPDLIKWTKRHFSEIILKPVHGYSGKGILIGFKRKNPDEDIEYALKCKCYIVQKMVPLGLWAEEYPWLDRENKRILIKRWQTDFRCFLTDQGLIGFVTRFGGIPTNVGSGGGVQPTAILRDSISVKEAIQRINEAILNAGYDFISQVQDELNRRSMQMGNVYLLGPIMTTLRPRIITPAQLESLKVYAGNLWNDLIRLARLFQEGRLCEFTDINEEEEAIAKMDPWQGRAGLVASDGLFDFGGSL